jgi:MoaD family protein
MHIHFFAAYHNLTGVRNWELKYQPGSTLKDAVDAIIKQFPVLEAHWLAPDGNLQAHLTVILNKVDASSGVLGLDTLLKEDDEIDFLPPVGGG